jgi:hypothetical protein
LALIGFFSTSHRGGKSEKHMSLKKEPNATQYRPKIPSFYVARRNFFAILTIFVITQIPILIFSSVFGQSVSIVSVVHNEIINSNDGNTNLDLILFILNEFAFLFRLTCLSVLTAKTIFDKNASIEIVPVEKINIFLKISLLGLPVIGMEILAAPLLAIFLLITIFLLRVFAFLVIPAVSLRHILGWKAYAYSWNLARNNWWRLISLYIESNTVILVIACPLYLTIQFLITHSYRMALPYLGIMADLLYLWVMVEMILLYLDIESAKTVNANSPIDPKHYQA